MANADEWHKLAPHRIFSRNLFSHSGTNTFSTTSSISEPVQARQIDRDAWSYQQHQVMSKLQLSF